jgi:two-component system sensor histidine kinase ChiS
MQDRILLVDDESDLIEMLQWQLAEEGFSVASATSGQEALEILKRERIAIVISDIRMPGMDGIELVRRAKEIIDDVQCIFITGHGGRKIAVEATKLGGFSYLQKPLSIQELVVAIEKAREKLDLLRALRALRQESEEREEILVREIRKTIFDIMNIAVRYWELAYGKTRAALAEESGVWSVQLDRDSGCYRTRTLDRYLKIPTIPKNPNYNKVLNTGSFVLRTCNRMYPDLDAQLQKQMARLIDLHRELEIVRSS